MTKHPEALRLIDDFGMQALAPEGGCFVRTFTAEERLDTPFGPRPVSTAIYYLLPADEVSRVHRLESTELWHFYAGDPVVHETWWPELGDEVRSVQMGPNAPQQLPQVIVPAGAWQTALVLPGPHGYALIGATVSPGYEQEDFSLLSDPSVVPSRIAKRWEKFR